MLDILFSNPNHASLYVILSFIATVVVAIIAYFKVAKTSSSALVEHLMSTMSEENKNNKDWLLEQLRVNEEKHNAEVGRLKEEINQIREFYKDQLTALNDELIKSQAKYNNEVDRLENRLKEVQSDYEKAIRKIMELEVELERFKKETHDHNNQE